MKRKLLALLLTAGVIPLEVDYAAQVRPGCSARHEAAAVAVGVVLGWIAHKIVSDDEPQASPFQPEPVYKRRVILHERREPWRP